MTWSGMHERTMGLTQWWRTHRAALGADCGTWQARALTNAILPAWRWHWCANAVECSNTQQPRLCGRLSGFRNLGTATDGVGGLCRSCNIRGGTGQRRRRASTSWAASRRTCQQCRFCWARHQRFVAPAAGERTGHGKQGDQKSQRPSASTPHPSWRDGLLIWRCDARRPTFELTCGPKARQVERGVSRPPRKPAQPWSANA